MELLRKFAAIMTGILAAMVAYSFICWGEVAVDPPILTPTATAIMQLAPRVDPVKANTLARHFDDAGSDTGIDPLILVAIAMRESGFRADIESTMTRGSRGEIGLMQTHGVALGFRPDHCGAGLESAECQIWTGARYLAYVARQCPGSWTRKVSAYGRSSCPTEELASLDYATKRARSYYLAIKGMEW